MFASIRKLVVAVVGLVALIVNRRYGVDITGLEPGLVDAIIAVITAAAVYYVPNARGRSTYGLNVHPMAVLAALLMAFAVTACAQVAPIVEKGRAYAGEGLANALVAECLLTMDQRKANAKAIDDAMVKLQTPARVVAQDCDGDGKPDF